MGKNQDMYKTHNVNERTPKALYDDLDGEFSFDFDPCPLNADFDGLKIDWGKHVFINPPYTRGQIKLWLEKGLNEIEKGNTNIIVFLLPSYTDVFWFHEIVLPKAHEIRFIKGRLKFGNHNNSAPFGSMVVVFKEKK